MNQNELETKVAAKFDEKDDDWEIRDFRQHGATDEFLNSLRILKADVKASRIRAEAAISKCLETI